METSWENVVGNLTHIHGTNTYEQLQLHTVGTHTPIGLTCTVPTKQTGSMLARALAEDFEQLDVLVILRGVMALVKHNHYVGPGQSFLPRHRMPIKVMHL